MSSNFSRMLVLLVAVCALASGCKGGKPSLFPDSGEDAGFDAGELETGFDAGEPDGGEDAGPPELKIFKVLPPRGAAGGGTQVLITGQGFVRGFATLATEAKKLTTLKFGSNPSLDFQVIDDGTIDAKVPAGRAGLANVTINNGNGLFVCSGCFTFYEELYLTGVSPKQGPLRGGNEVVLDGQGFAADVHVLFGAQSSPGVTLVNSKQLKVVVPRGLAADSVDITVYNSNGVGLQRRVYRYVEDVAVSAVAPRFGPLAGGTQVVLTGQGFEGVSAVKFGALPAASFTVDSPTQVTAVSPAAAVVGAVDLTVETPRDSWVARGAFAYVGSGSTQLFAVSPHLGASAGGDTVTLVGQGLDLPGLTVTFGGASASLVSQSANEVVVVAPARGGAARKVSVTASDGATSTTLAGAYTYRLELVSMRPPSGPASGGTAVTLTGEAFPADIEVFVGSLAATVNGAPTETQVQLSTPPGSSGAPNDVRVREASDPENEAVLKAAFTFEEPLSIGRVQPDRGAIAGSTLVTLRGTGFGEGVVVTFGAEQATVVAVVDAHTLVCRTPKADVGTVEVRIEQQGASALLPGGFSYYDPRNTMGGPSGGPLVGTLNVTVLESTRSRYGMPVPEANVVLGIDDQTPFQGQTDSRGQLTFSDPSLVKAQTVTMWKKGFESTTITAVSSENLTFLTGGKEDPSSGPPPPPQTASVISGRVTGFKAPHPLNANESLEARVFVSQTSFYEGPPYYSPNFTGWKWLVRTDGSKYMLYTRAGLHATYAVLGVKNTETGTFEPYLMGIRRGITTSSDKPAVDQDIILDMHLDLSVPITIDSPINISDGTTPPEPATNTVYAWLDLGAEGFVPNPYNWGTGTSASSSVASKQPTLSFPGFPRLDGSSFVFLDKATGTGYGESVFFRRQPGGLTAGITIGPLLPVPVITQPTSVGLTGLISWTTEPGPTPDLVAVTIVKPTQGGDVSLWTAVLPGNEKEVVLPQQALRQLLTTELGNTLSVQVTAARTVKFNYAQWTYESLWADNWSSYTMSSSVDFVP